MDANQSSKVAKVSYTVETRRGPVRKSKEVTPDRVDKTIDQLTEKGAFNFDVVYEA